MNDYNIHILCSSLVPRPLYACGARFLPRRNKDLVQLGLGLKQSSLGVRQTTLFGTLLYDTFCVENCVMFGGGEGRGVKNVTMTLFFPK